MRLNCLSSLKPTDQRMVYGNVIAISKMLYSTLGIGSPPQGTSGGDDSER